MAKNVYKQKNHSGTYSCGHSGKVRVGGYSQEYRDEEAERIFSGLCPECQKAENAIKYEKEAEEAKMIAEEKGLPELEGSPKQIQWAEVIRIDFIKAFSSFVKSPSIDDFYFADIENIKKFMNAPRDGISKKELELEDYSQITNNLLKAMASFISNETASKIFIDYRNSLSLSKGMSNTLIDLLAEYKEKDPLTEEEISRQEEIDEELTIRPENYNNIDTKIKSNENKVYLESPKDDVIIEIVKNMRYSWNGSVWFKSISEFTGTKEERMVELANKLLNAGFAVIVETPEIKDKAINADFEPECTRWVLKSVKDGYLAIKWIGFNDDLYEKAMSIRGAKWDSAVLVPISNHAAVLEFADLYGFKITKKAMQIIEEYISSGIDRVNVAPPAKQERRGGVEAILNSSTEVLDELKDD